LSKQVLIEAKILEVTLRDGYEAGINWAKFLTPGSGTLGIGQLSPGTQLGTTASGALLQGGAPTGGAAVTPLVAGATATVPQLGITNLGTPALGAIGGAGATLAAGLAAAGSIFGIAFQGASFAALLTFLETQGVVHTLSSPRIATMNNQKAVLKVGSDALFVTKIVGNSTTTTAAIGAAAVPSTPTFEVQSFFSGIALDVTPNIGDDDSVVLHVRPTVSTVSQNLSTFNLGTQGTFVIPLVSNEISETDSVIRGRDGQIVAIGGLMRQAQTENRDQVPALGNIPFLGAAFRNTRQTSEKRELVILLKPTVIQSDQNWAQNIDDARNRVQMLNRGFSYGGRSDVFGTQAEERRP
jgi:MSHA biogenesis protein MshL